MWKFFTNFRMIFNFLLIIEGILSFVIPKDEDYCSRDHILYGIFFLAIFLLNVFLIYFQENSQKNIENFKRLLILKCNVRRDGKEIRINTKNLVRGDLLIINQGQGDQIAADIQIISNHGLKFQQSNLNGESGSIEGTSNRIEISYKRIREIWAGSKCVEGSGIGIVKATGHQTILGHMVQESAGQYRSKTPTIQNQIDKIAGIIILLDIILVILTVIISIEYNRTFNNTLY